MGRCSGSLHNIRMVLAPTGTAGLQLAGPGHPTWEDPAPEPWTPVGQDFCVPAQILRTKHFCFPALLDLAGTPRVIHGIANRRSSDYLVNRRRACLFLASHFLLEANPAAAAGHGPNQMISTGQDR